jgi:hypothetical protein
MMYVAILGSKALWLLYLWLGSAVIASYLAERKGYGERVGLACGLLLTVVGVIIWAVWPAKPDSRWKLQGPFGSGGKTVAEARAERDAAEREG